MNKGPEHRGNGRRPPTRLPLIVGIFGLLLSTAPARAQTLSQGGRSTCTWTLEKVRGKPSWTRGVPMTGVRAVRGRRCSKKSPSPILVYVDACVLDNEGRFTQVGQPTQGDALQPSSCMPPGGLWRLDQVYPQGLMASADTTPAALGLDGTKDAPLLLANGVFPEAFSETFEALESAWRLHLWAPGQELASVVEDVRELVPDFVLPWLPKPPGTQRVFPEALTVFSDRSIGGWTGPVVIGTAEFEDGSSCSVISEDKTWQLAACSPPTEKTKLSLALFPLVGGDPDSAFGLQPPGRGNTASPNPGTAGQAILTVAKVQATVTGEVRASLPDWPPPPQRFEVAPYVGWAPLEIAMRWGANANLVGVLTGGVALWALFLWVWLGGRRRELEDPEAKGAVRLEVAPEKRTPMQQLNELKERLGKGKGAVKEGARLQKPIEREIPLEELALDPPSELTVTQEIPPHEAIGIVELSAPEKEQPAPIGVVDLPPPEEIPRSVPPPSYEPRLGGRPPPPRAEISWVRGPMWAETLVEACAEATQAEEARLLPEGRGFQFVWHLSRPQAFYEQVAVVYGHLSLAAFQGHEEGERWHQSQLDALIGFEQKAWSAMGHPEPLPLERGQGPVPVCLVTAGPRDPGSLKRVRIPLASHLWQGFIRPYVPWPSLAQGPVGEKRLRAGLTQLRERLAARTDLGPDLVEVEELLEDLRGRRWRKPGRLAASMVLINPDPDSRTLPLLPTQWRPFHRRWRDAFAWVEETE